MEAYDGHCERVILKMKNENEEKGQSVRFVALCIGRDQARIKPGRWWCVLICATWTLSSSKVNGAAAAHGSEPGSHEMREVTRLQARDLK